MRILKTNELSENEIIAETVAVLQAGGLIIFPTETTYGAGVYATNQAAVDKLLAYKSRREGKPLSIAVTDLEMAQRYVEVNDQARTLYERFLPGPMTVVSRGLGMVAEGVESEFGTLGVRIPDYPLILKIVRTADTPITATSANGSGKKRPYTIDDIFANLSDKQKSLIDLVIDAGKLPPNQPSTVIDTTLSAPVTLRSGEIVLNNAQKTELISHSEDETKAIAGRLLLKQWNDVRETGVVIGLSGTLGMGKTIFAKGSAEFLQIEEILTSPTYTYIEEYPFRRHDTEGMLYHLDMWKVESAEEFARLEIGQLLRPNTVVVIEWIDQVWEWLAPVLQEKNITPLLVEFSETDDARTLTIQDPS